MSASDDDEMAALRASRSHNPKVRAVPTPLPQPTAPPLDEPAEPGPMALPGDEPDQDGPTVLDQPSAEERFMAEMAECNLPVQFGKKENLAPKRKSKEEAHSAYVRGPQRESAAEPEESPNDGLAVSEATGEALPISHEIHLKGHTRAITSMSLDPKGARLLTGGADNNVYMWDFAGMTSSLRSFRNFEPHEGYPISCVRWNNTGAQFAVSTGEPRMKVYDRDGHELAIFTKGDMYIYDPQRTKGHTHPVTGFQWHPHEKNVVVSCSKDCSIRVFDIDREKKWKSASGGYGSGDIITGAGSGIVHRDIAVLKNRQGRKTQVSAVAYSTDGGYIGATGVDGSLQLYRTSGRFQRPDLVCWDAHAAGTETSCVRFSRDGRILLTRGGDDTLKVWDVRQLNSPLKTFDGLVSYFDTSECCFSPDDNLILAGTSAKKGETGRLLFINSSTFDMQYSIDLVPSGSVVSVVWNGAINQIVAGGSDGARVLYSPELSIKGAMSCAGRKARQANALESALGGTIYNPHALPLYQRQTGKRKRESVRHTLETKKPPMPTTEQNSSSIYHSFMMQGLKSKDNRTQDPREVYLAKSDPKNTSGAADNPWFKKGQKDYVAHIYKKNQPKTILQEETQEEAQAREDRQ